MIRQLLTRLRAALLGRQDDWTAVDLIEDVPLTGTIDQRLAWFNARPR